LKNREEGMKKVAVLVALLFVLCPLAYAGHHGCDPAPSVTNTTIVNEMLDRDNPLGVGMDFVLYNSEMWWLDEVNLETRFDFENDEQAVFCVFRVDTDKIRRELVGW